MLKVTDTHSSVTNRFSWANTSLKSSFGDFRGLNGDGPADLRSTPKLHQTRRSQQTTDQQRQITYRSSDHAWNDHPSNPNVSNQAFRSDSLNKTKISTSTRQFSNGTPHETATTSMPHLANTPLGHPQRQRDDANNGDPFMSSRPKSRQITRSPQRTSINLEKTSASNGFNLPARHGSYHSTRLDPSVYPRQGTSKQRSYVASKSSLQDPGGAELFVNGSPDESSYYFHQPSSGMSSMQRLTGSTFDITSSRKPFPANKSYSFNSPSNGNYNSARDLHRSETNVDKTNATRLAIRGTATSRELYVATPNKRRTPTIPTSSANMLANIRDERDRSAQSYKSRDPNVSYAYTNVKKYIEENDLMTPEKEHSIRNWIIDVDKYRHEFQKTE